MKRTCLTLTLTFLAMAATAQGHQHGDGGSHSASTPAATGLSPYAELRTRQIKALSDQQTQDLLAGRGMSLALAAELNGYPGPSHVLELAQPLRLTPDQISRTQDLYKQMVAEAIASGQVVIEAELRLDRLFKGGKADHAALRKAVNEAAAAMGALRETHLGFHLSMMEVLSPAQVAAYARLRGYSPGKGG